MPHEQHLPILKDLGLSETEALIYELLLEKGPSTGAALTKEAGIGRGNVYNTLASLKARALVREEVGPKNIFTAVDPENLRELALRKRAAADQLVRQLESVMPDLKSFHHLFTKQPTVRVFEGVEGIKDVYRETFKAGQPIFALVGPDEPAPELFHWLTSQYVKERVARKIPAYVVASGTTAAEEYRRRDKEELRTTRLVSGTAYPFTGEIDVFADKVALVAYKSDELIGTIIESPGVAETLRSAIKLLIAYLPE